MTTGGILQQKQVPIATLSEVPGAGYGSWFPGDDDLPHFLQSDGTVLDLSYGGSSPTFAHVTLSGTGGSGYYEVLAQASNPSAPGSTGARIFAGATGELGWVRKNGGDTFVRQFASTLTADRTYTLFDASGKLLMEGQAIGATTPAAITGTIVTANTRFVSPILAPAADGTTALTVTKADGSTAQLTFDTTNSIVTTAGALTIGGSGAATGTLFNSTAIITYNGGGSVVVGHRISASAVLTALHSSAFREANIAVNFDTAGFNSTLGIGNGGGVVANAMSVTISGTSGTVTAATPATFSLTKSNAGGLTAGLGGIVLAFTASGGGTFTNVVGWLLANQTVGTNNTLLHVGDTTVSTGNWALNVKSTYDSSFAGKATFGASASAPGATLDVFTTDSGTTSVAEVALFTHNSSGTPAANFGTQTTQRGQSSTTTNRSMGGGYSQWTTATDASRKANYTIFAFDTAQRDGARVIADGTGAIFEVLAGSRIAVRVITAAGAVTVTNQDYVVVVNKTVGAATTVNLPAGVANQMFVIKDGKGDAGTNNITITPAAGNLDGAGTLVLNTNYGKATIVYNGTQWNVIA